MDYEITYLPKDESGKLQAIPPKNNAPSNVPYESMQAPNDEEYEVTSAPQDYDNNQEESNLEYGTRTTSRGLARAGEAIVGLPGDIASGLHGLANYGIEKSVGKKDFIPNFPYPTSDAVRRHITKPLTGEYLEPKSGTEKFYDDIIGDAATLLIPTNAGAKITQLTLKGASKALGKSVSRAAMANTAKWAGEALTDSPFVGAIAKMGTLFLSGMRGTREKIKDWKDDLYPQSMSKIPKGTTTNVVPQQNSMKTLINEVNKSDIPKKDFLTDRLESFNKLIKPNVPGTREKTAILDQYGKPLSKRVPGKRGGTIDVKELINLKKGWNNHLQTLSPKSTEFNYLKRGVGILNDAIETYGSKNHEFYQPYRMAEELHGALANSNLIKNFIDRYPAIRSKVDNPIVQHILGYSASHAIKDAHLGKSLGLTGLGVGAYESAKALQLIMSSPVAKKAYQNAAKAAVRKDAAGLARSLSVLNKAANTFMKS